MKKDTLTSLIICAIVALPVAFLHAQGTVSDVDGNVYPTIIIGSQEWMTENLRTTKLNDGTPIQLIIQNRDWTAARGAARSWCDNDSAKFHARYGFLYNGYAVLTDKLCPQGWKIPGDTEWDQMMTTLGGSEVAGGKMKTTGTADWADPNEGASNSSGWSGLPGGWRSQTDGSFQFQGFRGGWWITSGRSVMFRFLSYSLNSCGFGILTETAGVSVRCMNSKGASSIRQADKTNSVKIYPSPARNLMSVEISENEQFLNLKILSSNGKLFYENKIVANSIQIDVSHWPAGMYVAQLTGENSVTMLKFIKD